MTIAGTLPVGLVAVAPLAGRAHAAALRGIARWGVAETTLADVAREAGCSRATIYRTLAGGKQALVTSLAVRGPNRLGDRAVVEPGHVRTPTTAFSAGSR